MIRLAMALLPACTGYRVEAVGAAAAALVACDYGQTLWASDYGRWDRPSLARGGTLLYEKDPLLGTRPSVLHLDVAALLAEWGLIGLVMSPTPTWAKYAALGAVAAAETYIVAKDWSATGACGVGNP